MLCDRGTSTLAHVFISESDHVALICPRGREKYWYDSQFSLIAPKFEAYGVDLWVPDWAGSTTRVIRRTRC
jgi:hypothetical protein